MQPKLKLLKEVLPELGFSRTKALRLACRGQLPTVKIAGLWYFVGDVDQWLRDSLQARAAGRCAAQPRQVAVRHARRHVPEASGIADLMPVERRFGG